MYPHLPPISSLDPELIYSPLPPWRFPSPHHPIEIMEEENGRHRLEKARRPLAQMGFLEAEMARRRLKDYVEALEGERKKMLVFHRELPFSLELVSRALESYRLQLEGGEVVPARSNCEEEMSSEEPVLKEFLPTSTTRGGFEEDEEEEVEEEEVEKEEEEVEENREQGEEGGRSRKVPDWMRSVQLCDPQRESAPKEDVKDVKPITVEEKNPTGAFQPLPKVSTAAAASPVGATGGGSGSRSRGGADEKEGLGHRKSRRCWSPELHQRFLQALQQLGGSHVATPKQIRELMKVDGLTNDEVKSHLQKYRLHTRRASPPARPNSCSNNSQTQPPHIVFIGSIWAPPSGLPEHTSTAAAAAHPLPDRSGSPANRIYAPIASIPVLQQQQQQNKKQKLMSCREERSFDGGRSNSDSSATSSSSHTITTTESPRK